MTDKSEQIALMLTGFVKVFVYTFNCLHEAGAVSRTQAIQSLEGAIRGLLDDDIDKYPRLFLTSIVGGLRLLEQGKGPPPLPPSELLKLV